MEFENETNEYKRQFTDEIYKEVVAFANTEGGTITIGVADDLTVVGIDDIDGTYTKVTNGIRDNILPDITMFIKYSLLENKVIRIEISEGANKPYYLKAKGLKPSGVFVRQGASSVQTSLEHIRKMIKGSDGDVYEDMRSIDQELTFSEAQAIFRQKNVEFQPEQYVRLGICNLNFVFSNAGKVLSDQCSHTVKIAVFADEENTIFKDNKEFHGSALKQMENAYSYLMLCNQNKSEIHGLDRIDHWDYPSEAIREALLNAIVHRDYSYSGSIIINVNEKQMEFISIGGLVLGLRLEDIGTGISQPRNPHLADIFHRLHYVEAYGTGIRRINKMYKASGFIPKIEVTQNTFKIILPNMNNAEKAIELKSVDNQEGPPVLTNQMKEVLRFLDDHSLIREEEVQELLRVKKTRAYLITRQMIDMGLLTVNGRGNEKAYEKCSSL
jgi:ATP-dependent DNA helicase RecG